MNQRRRLGIQYDESTSYCQFKASDGRATGGLWEVALLLAPAAKDAVEELSQEHPDGSYTPLGLFKESGAGA